MSDNTWPQCLTLLLCGLPLGGSACCGPRSSPDNGTAVSPPCLRLTSKEIAKQRERHRRKQSKAVQDQKGKTTNKGRTGVTGIVTSLRIEEEKHQCGKASNAKEEKLIKSYLSLCLLTNKQSLCTLQMHMSRLQSLLIHSKSCPKWPREMVTSAVLSDHNCLKQPCIKEKNFLQFSTI